MTVADRIRNRRLELNMTQKELSDRIGTKDRSSISKIEARGNDISLKDIERIAVALDTTSAYLLGWSTEEYELSDGTKATVSSYPANLEPMTTGQVEMAISLYEKYISADPHIRNAVDALLKDIPPASEPLDKH